MKNIALISLLLAVLLTICLAGCSQSNDGDVLDKFEQLIEELDSETKSTPARPFAQQVYIVIPKAASAELKAKAVELAEAIYAKTKVDAMVKYDYEELHYREDDLMIFVGDTDSVASDEVTSRLRRGEYLCKWYGGDIVIGARDDAAAISALDEFTEVILPGASSGALMSSGARLEHRGEYEFSSVTLNGYDLYDYTFVCSESTLEKVSVLTDYIESRSGYMVSVCDGSESVEGKKICFVLDGDCLEATVEPRGQDILVRGCDEYGLSMAVADFAKRLFENSPNGAAKADISQKRTMPSYSRSLKMCAAWYLNNGKANVRQITDMVERIQREAFDLVILDKINGESLDDISFNLTDDYGIKTKTLESGEHLSVIYKEESFESLECELGEDLLTVTVVADGERAPRKIVKLLDGGADLGDISGYDTVIAFDDISEEHSLEKIGETSWEFGAEYYSCFMLTSPALCIDGDEANAVKVGEAGYINAYLYANISVEYCAEFEALKNAVN